MVAGSLWGVGSIVIGWRFFLERPPEGPFWYIVELPLLLRKFLGLGLGPGGVLIDIQHLATLIATPFFGLIIGFLVAKILIKVLMIRR